MEGSAWGVAWGVAMVVLSLLAWGGQAIALVAPGTAARMTLTESEEEVEPAFWADVRGEALWDTLTLWVLVVAGVLLVLGVSAWAYLGLVGGGVYVYFAGRGILTRRQMMRRGLRIGSAESVRMGMVMLALWGLMGAATVVAASAALTAA